MRAVARSARAESTGQSLMATISQLQERLQKPDTPPVILDGAVGTELEQRGVPLPAGLWSAAALRSHPGLVEEIHREYVAAGAEIIVANTFRVAHRSLASTGLDMDGERLARQAADLARAAVNACDSGSTCWIAASVGPVADCYRPEDTPPDAVLRAEFQQTFAWLSAGQPDLLWVETMNTVREAAIVAELAQQARLPFAINFILREDGYLLGGESLREGVEAVSPFNPLAIGLNCMPPSGITRHLGMLRELTSFPIAAYAHVGNATPLPGWSYAESLGPAEYAGEAVRWSELGARIIGGCCGTTPAFIALLRRMGKGG